MAIRFTDKYIAIALEDSYSSGGAVSGSTVVRAMNLNRERYAGPKLKREYDRKTMGSYSSINASPHVTLSFETEMTAPLAAAGDPVFDILLKACGFLASDVAAEANPAAWAAGQDLVVGDKRSKGGKSYMVTQAHRSAAANAPDVEGGADYWMEYTPTPGHKLYVPRHEEFQSMRVEYWQNRNKQVIQGCRGNVEIVMEREQFPKLVWNFTGKYQTEADAAPLANVNIAKWTPPLPVNAANTGFFSYGTQKNLRVSSVRINLNNNVVWRDLINLASVQISNRTASFNMSVEGEKLTDWDSKADYESHKGTIPLREMLLRHGPTSGRYFELFSDGVQVESISDTNSDEVLEWSMDGMVTPEGPNNKELELRFF